jgi:hypothetical protein
MEVRIGDNQGRIGRISKIHRAINSRDQRRRAGAQILVINVPTLLDVGDADAPAIAIRPRPGPFRIDALWCRPQITL